MRKFMTTTLLLCCGLLWNVNVSAQDAIAVSAKSDCKVSTACCKSASADAKTTSEAIRVSMSSDVKAKSSAGCAGISRTASTETSDPIQQSATMVALLNYLPTTTTSVRTNCKPANCDPTNCAPEDCPPACKKFCPAQCDNAGVAQVLQKS